MFAIYVDVLARHGARSPAGYYIQDVHNLQTLLKNTSVVKINYFISSWVDPFNIKTAAQLIKLGKEEQYTLVKRFYKRFQSLLSSESDNIRYYATSKKRTQDSVKYFQQGMMGKVFSDDMSNIFDPIL